MPESSNNVIKENSLNRNNDVQAQYIIFKGLWFLLLITLVKDNDHDNVKDRNVMMVLSQLFH